MKLQPASRRELKHIAVGTLICSAVMVAVFVLLSVTGIYPSVFWQVLLSALLGSAVAIVNFALLCLTVQSAAEKAGDAGAVKARVQTSYTSRLALQGLPAGGGSRSAAAFSPRGHSRHANQRAQALRGRAG